MYKLKKQTKTILFAIMIMIFYAIRGIEYLLALALLLYILDKVDFK